MNKLVTLGVASIAAVAVIGVSSLSASALTNSNNGNGTGIQARDGSGNGNGRQSSLESRAKVVGMTAAELDTALQTKTMSQIAKDRGMTEEQFQAKMGEAAKARWASRGLSSDEIATRTADREQRQAANEASYHEFGTGAGNHQSGYRHNR